MEKLPDNLHKIMAQFLDKDYAKEMAFVDAHTATLDDIRQIRKTGLVYINDKDFGTERYLEITDEGENYRRAFFPTKDEQIADLRASLEEAQKRMAELFDACRNTYCHRVEVGLGDEEIEWQQGRAWRGVDKFLSESGWDVKSDEDGYYNVRNERMGLIIRYGKCEPIVKNNKPSPAPPDGYIALSDFDLGVAEEEDRDFQTCHICGEQAEGCHCFDEFIDDDVDLLGPPDWMKDK